MDLLVKLDYLEYDGKHRNIDNDFMYYVKIQNPLFCYYYDSICNLGKMTTTALEASPSINLIRSDWDRVKVYLKVRGGTSVKNLIHMA